MLKTPLLGVLLLLLGTVKAIGQTNFVEIELKASQLSESSGVCVSRDGRIIWTHNDSGDGSRLFAFHADGRLLKRIEIRGAEAIDWEDVCAFEAQGESFLAIGDIGDNSAKRKAVQIYVLKMPDAKKKTAKIYSRFEISFPDGPVDCEGLAYDPIRKQFMLFTKELFRCRMFSISAESLQRSRSTTAKFEKTFGIGMVTGADISRDGKQLAILTYAPLLLLKREGFGWPLNTDDDLYQMPRRRQGEAVSFGPKGRQLLLTSEHSPTPLFRVNLDRLVKF